MSQPLTEVARWAYVAKEDAVASVLPDGCRDLIVRKAPGKAPVLFVSALGEGLERPEIHAGVQLHGVRLPPGATVDEHGLRSRWARQPDEILDKALVAEHVHVDERVQEALIELAFDVTRSTAVVAERLGVSLRTLQRLFRRTQLPAPDFWRRLVRVRRAGRAVVHGKIPQPLARIAAAHGYADQAHLTREVRHWFGVTPGQLRRAPQLAAVLDAAGYD